MQPFKIWIEGYAATGEHSPASYNGTYEAETFDDAVELYLADKENTTWADIRKYYKKEKRFSHKEGEVKTLKTLHSIWTCRLFDNEIDARKSFG